MHLLVVHHPTSSSPGQQDLLTLFTLTHFIFKLTVCLLPRLLQLQLHYLPLQLLHRWELGFVYLLQSQVLVFHVEFLLLKMSFQQLQLVLHPQILFLTRTRTAMICSTKFLLSSRVLFLLFYLLLVFSLPTSPLLFYLHHCRVLLQLYLLSLPTYLYILPPRQSTRE